MTEYSLELSLCVEITIEADSFASALEKAGSIAIIADRSRFPLDSSSNGDKVLGRVLVHSLRLQKPETKEDAK